MKQKIKLYTAEQLNDATRAHHSLRDAMHNARDVRVWQEEFERAMNQGEIEDALKYLEASHRCRVTAVESARQAIALLNAISPRNTKTIEIETFTNK